MTLRWTFTLGTETYVFEMNPNQATLQTAAEAVEIAPLRARVGVSTRVAAPTTFSVGGVLRTQAQYMALKNWSEGGRRIQLVDHLNRHYVVRIVDFQPSTQAPARRNAPWRHTYNLNLVVYSGPDAA